MASVKRLIDANALMEEIEFEYDLNYGETLTDPRKFADMVEDAPTVDAVEVVHCGSCRFAEDETADGWLWCGKWNEGSECGGYCHKGERKDNGK